MPPSASTNSKKPVHRDILVETNVEAIRALEEQIREHETAIIRLKRTRNSLLNVSKISPEILGEIFRWNAALRGEFGRLKRSHNFLLVCHQWFEVASSTPELWSFWGNNLQDWTKRHLQHPTAPLDFVFKGGPFNPTAITLSDSLWNALEDRATRDAIRRIHLNTDDPDILNSILSPLVSHDRIRSSSVESIIIRCDQPTEAPRVSDFLARYRFPKLRHLELDKCSISSWDLITSKTSALTSLTLDSQYLSGSIGSSQLLSILRSNQSLREISLSWCAIPDADEDDSGGASSQVPLVHLRELDLAGGLQNVFALLHQLDYPRDLDNLCLDLEGVTVEHGSEIIGPYLRDHLRRRTKSENWLGLYLSSSSEWDGRFSVGDANRTDFSAPELAWMDTPVTIIISQFQERVPIDEVLLALLACVPQEEITYCRTSSTSISTEVLSVQLPYLRVIHFDIPLRAAFPKSNLDQDGIFPYLQHIRIILDGGLIRRGDWRTLATFLEHLASSGNKLNTLEVVGFGDVGPAVESRIRRVVREVRVISDGDYDMDDDYSTNDDRDTDDDHDTGDNHDTDD